MSGGKGNKIERPISLRQGCLHFIGIVAGRNKKDPLVFHYR